jgi:hypothetical protein
LPGRGVAAAVIQFVWIRGENATLLPYNGSKGRGQIGVYASVDPILDKISKSGTGSLTASERRILDSQRLPRRALLIRLQQRRDVGLQNTQGL